MDIIQIDTDDRRRVRQFIELPFRIYHNTPQWVPPLASDMQLILDRRRYPFYRHSEADFFLAVDGGRAVGRIVAIDNRNFNAFHHENTGFFYLFECEDSLEASGALFEAACAWARARGLTRIVGPKGFTALDGMGLLVKGFDLRPAIGIPYNPPYYQALIEAAGFERLDDDVSGQLDVSAPFPEHIHRLSEIVQRRRGLRILRLKNKRELRAIIPQVGEMYNRSVGANFDQVPLTADEIKAMADQLLPIADPSLIMVVMKGDDPVGFLLAYPDISAALQRCKGRLFPFGWLDILIESKRTKWINVNGGGVVERYRGLGGTAVLFSELQKAAVAGGYKHAEGVQISVSNDKMQREMRDLGIDFNKMHRMYQRAL
ncbi:MAG TPA: hypothetical protein PLJ35_07095 [Anaerolineae bacterium]|nr:hypothetical protein [Anaerolineae bacterium]HOQ98574.1 hypothetical protein [Anaerolineae bacterium]HPL27680.1 hypothetical protein [Anaerolineae bacterium]